MLVFCVALAAEVLAQGAQAAGVAVDVLGPMKGRLNEPLNSTAMNAKTMREYSAFYNTDPLIREVRMKQIRNNTEYCLGSYQNDALMIPCKGVTVTLRSNPYPIHLENVWSFYYVGMGYFFLDRLGYCLGARDGQVNTATCDNMRRLFPSKESFLWRFRDGGKVGYYQIANKATEQCLAPPETGQLVPRAVPCAKGTLGPGHEQVFFIEKY